MLLAGCADDDNSGAGRSDALDCGRFVVFDEPAWDFLEAVDYPEDLGSFGEIEPGLDWYSEFERIEPAADGASSEGVSLRISGHSIGLAEFRREMPGGDEFQERHGEDGLTLLIPSTDVEPSVLVRSVTDDYTLMLLSYGLDLDELTEVAAATRPACEQEWLDVGGRILDCMPTEPDCDGG